MKTITLILVMLSCTAYSQNRFEKSFSKADSLFSLKYENQKVEIDSNQVIINQTIDMIESLDYDSLLIPASDLLLIYWGGYIDGGLNSLETGHFDYHRLKQHMLRQKKSIQHEITWQKMIRSMK